LPSGGGSTELHPVIKTSNKRKGRIVLVSIVVTIFLKFYCKIKNNTANVVRLKRGLKEIE